MHGRVSMQKHCLMNAGLVPPVLSYVLRRAHNGAVVPLHAVACCLRTPFYRQYMTSYHSATVSIANAEFSIGPTVKLRMGNNISLALRTVGTGRPIAVPTVGTRTTVFELFDVE